MTTQLSKQRQDWKRAEKATQWLKDAISGVVGDSLKKQHVTILSEINAEFDHNTIGCSHCCLDTLMPLHTKVNDVCPLQQKDCNCLNAQGKTLCPSKFCSAMYDEIIKHHRFNSPNWSKTDIKQWYTNIWEVAKCFIPVDKRIDELTGDSRKCFELLYVSINNVAVLGSSQDRVLELLTQIINAQIKIFNSPNKVIDEITFNAYIIDVIRLIQNEWLRRRTEATYALVKLYQYARRKKDKEEIDQSEVRAISNRKIFTSDYLRTTFTRLFSENEMMRKRLDKVEKEQNMLQKEQKKFEKDQHTIKERQSVFYNFFHHLKLNLSDKDQDVNQCSTETDTESFSNEKKTSVISTHDTQDVDLPNDKDLETPVISRPLDGRLITLDNKQIDALMKTREPNVLQGGFGDVFISKLKVPELDVHVVLKRITCEGHERIKKLSTLNEKIAARVMHFAIVPLIAYGEKEVECTKRAYYFLSPYLENRSLLGLIERDAKCSNIHDVMLRCGNRIQILFQVASALEYLHTPVPGYRGTVLHMDVTTMNIVLDQSLNARLIDFGLAREMNEGQQRVSFTQSRSFGTPGYYPTIRYSTLTVHEDFYNFGVVIRELLTGKQPYIERGDEVYELRKSSEVVIKKSLQKLIWTGPNEYALTLIRLSMRCLKSRDEKQFTSACIVKELKKILTKSNHQWRRAEVDKCDLCMVNAAVEDGKAPPHRCKVKICVSCMRNSRINPIRCPTCNEEVIPKIGHTFASLLIAGNDLNNSDFADSFRREIKEIKDVLASTYPCVIGISDENIKTIAPTNPGIEEILLPQVSAAFEFFKERKNIDTVLIYFTGHHDSKKGFVLGCPDDVLPVAKLQESLMKLCSFWENKARILVFLDCCEPPNMDINPALSKAGVKIIQINSCRQTEFCTQPLKCSLFQKFFVQALTRKIFNKQCYREEALGSKEKRCEDCKMSGDFISGEQLLEYISNHMKRFVNSKEPVLSMYDVSWRDAIIGYNVDFAVNLRLKFEMQSQTAIDVKLDQEFHSDIDELKLRILQKMTCGVQGAKLKLTDKFADVISLRIHTGSDNGKELSTILQVNAAINTNRDIIASYRSVSNIVSGRVALFVPTNCICQYFDEKEKLESTAGGRKVANLSFKDLDIVTDDIQEKPDFETLHSFLLNGFEAWDKETNKEGKALKVIFPCKDTENGSDFVVFELAEKAKGAASVLKEL